MKTLTGQCLKNLFRDRTNAHVDAVKSKVPSSLHPYMDVFKQHDADLYVKMLVSPRFQRDETWKDVCVLRFLQYIEDLITDRVENCGRVENIFQSPLTGMEDPLDVLDILNTYLIRHYGSYYTLYIHGTSLTDTHIQIVLHTDFQSYSNYSKAMEICIEQNDDFYQDLIYSEYEKTYQSRVGWIGLYMMNS